MPYKRGDVVLVLFPDSNLRTAKRRPALIVQANNLNTDLSHDQLIADFGRKTTDSPHPASGPLG